VKKPRILLYDLETSPNLGYTWGKFEQNVIKFARERDLLSIAYSWLGEKEIYCVTREGQKTDRELVKHIHGLFSEADLLVAHNGKAFDERRAKTRMAFYRMAPPKLLNSIDTLLIARRNFGFNGNSLGELAEHLGVGRKLKHTGFEMWEGCLADNAGSWAQLRKYNKRDVLLLKKVYKIFLPWIQNHPSVARMINPLESHGCPNCGSLSVHKRGFRYTRSQVQQEYACGNCKSRFSGKVVKDKK
jgi:predicted RNA-binding Zn-ribbon protein involved in translation (DUF1610 family)